MTNLCNSVIIKCIKIWLEVPMKKKIIPITVIIPLIVIAVISVLIIIVGKVMKISMSNKEEISLTDYYKIPAGEARLVVNLIKNDENALIRDKKVYLPYDVAEKILPRIYYDVMDDVIVYTTATEKYIYKAGEKEYETNGKSKTDEIPSFIEESGNIFVSADFIKKWQDFKIDVYENPGRIIIFENSNDDYKYCEVKENTELRECGSNKDIILKKLAAGDKVYLLENAAADFVRVFTEDGVTGYVKVNEVDIENAEDKKYTFDGGKQDEGYTSISRKEPIVLGWHQVTSEAANSGWGTALSKAEGVNVISPTWFGVADSEGELSSFASKDYVSKMHSLNIDVWPLLDDFNKDVDFKKLLTSTSLRTKLIKNITYFVDEYGLDGINIDFEKVKASYSKGYIQFLRELSIEMRNRNKVLSIDNYVPLEFNSFYNVKEQGILADYICVMAYDEHYSGSSEAGSVSSLGWVKKSVKNTAANVPMKKLIIGLPFYTRLWRETNDGKLKTKALGMEGGLNLVNASKAKKEWNEESGQYYAEWKDGKDRMRIWLEEEKSLAAKLKLFEKDKVAGIAFWKLGLERKEAWKSVTDWLK